VKLQGEKPIGEDKVNPKDAVLSDKVAVQIDEDAVLID